MFVEIKRGAAGSDEDLIRSYFSGVDAGDESSGESERSIDRWRSVIDQSRSHRQTTAGGHGTSGEVTSCFNYSCSSLNEAKQSTKFCPIRRLASLWGHERSIKSYANGSMLNQGLFLDMNFVQNRIYKK